MKTSAVWLSYDLGVRGDYPSLYAWLDGKSAKECGDSLAFFNYQYEGSIKAALKRELDDCMVMGKRSRIYIVFRERETNKIRGVFLYGGRRAPAWTGYADKGEDIIDEDV